MATSYSPSEILNPKQTLRRRMADAEGEDTGLAPATSTVGTGGTSSSSMPDIATPPPGMSQADFSGYATAKKKPLPIVKP